jgi:hypothetical protein
MAVNTLTYESEIWTITNDQETKIVTAEMKFLMRVAGYTRKDQIRNTEIREEPSIFNLNAKIIKSRSQRKYIRAANGRQADSEENSNIQPEKEKKHRTPTVKMEGSAYSSRGRNGPRMA